MQVVEDVRDQWEIGSEVVGCRDWSKSMTGPYGDLGNGAGDGTADSVGGIEHTGQSLRAEHRACDQCSTADNSET